MSTDDAEWLARQGLNSTKDIKIPRNKFDQVIESDDVKDKLMKAAFLKKNALLIGNPGTGKSFMAESMSEILQKQDLEDMLCVDNSKDLTQPLIKSFPAGKGKEVFSKAYVTRVEELKARIKTNARSKLAVFNIILILGTLVTIIMALFGQLLIAILTFFIMIIIIVLAHDWYKKKPTTGTETRNLPTILVSHNATDKTPFIKATGSTYEDLFGYINRNPVYEIVKSPSNQMVRPGKIHRANKGVLFIDNLNLLSLDEQKSLIKAMKDRKYPISGTIESGSLMGNHIETEPVPSDFVLIASINPDELEYSYSPLIEEILSNGCKISISDGMDDNDENRRKFVQFIAQEVSKQAIPDFDSSAIIGMLEESRRISGDHGKLSLKLKYISDIIETAGDIARTKKSETVTLEDVKSAIKFYGTGTTVA
jgi:Lon-like ATP-dependent protease